MKILIFLFLFFCSSVWAVPTFLTKWDANGDIKGVDGVLYLGRDNDPSCAGDLFIDEIKSFNYTASNGNLEIITKESHSPDGLFIYKDDLKDLDFDDNSKLLMFLKTKEKIIFFGETCGSGGYFNIGGMIKLSEVSNMK